MSHDGVEAYSSMREASDNRCPECYFPSAGEILKTAWHSHRSVASVAGGLRLLLCFGHPTPQPCIPQPPKRPNPDMKMSPPFTLARVFLGLMAWLSLSSIVQAQSIPTWEAFNDYSSSGLTSPNATIYKLRTAGDYGPLRDFATADDLAVTVAVENEGGTPDDFGARGGALDAGSPARKLFDGKVDLANDGLPGVRAAVKLTLVFSG